ncbi:MAG: RHS repeat protein, partial [Clostridia bacterium]|nr:RHS repeat protein [Clostridia bacterium]
NTDLSFSLVGTTLKENLVFSALPAETSYTYRLETTLRAEVQESGAVLFYADETPVIELAAPYLFDAAGEKSFDVSVTLSSVRDGYSYTVTPSRAWLADPARTYPVTLDPSFLEYNINNVKDNYAIRDLTSTQSSSWNTVLTNLSDKNKIGAGYPASNIKVGTLIYADVLSELRQRSVNARIVDARLVLAQTDDACPAGLVVRARKLTSDWNTANIPEDEYRLNDAIPSADSRILDYFVTESTLPENRQYTLDITAAVQEWSTGHAPNYGLYLDVASGAPVAMVKWGSSDQSTVAPPIFYVNYRETMGVEDYWTYSSVAAGRYGTAAVNHFNGNLVSLQSVCATDGLRMPVEIALTYNSGVQTEANFAKVGTGWKFNLESLLLATTGDLAADYPYYLLDSDGTIHYFTEGEEEDEWVDEDGLGLTMTEANTLYTLWAKDGSKSEFRKADGRLYRVYDSENNYVQVNYSTSQMRISSVRDGANRVYTFTYNSDGQVSMVTDPADREYTFTYSGTKLVSITYPDGVKTEFSYLTPSGTTLNLLSTIYKPDGSFVTADYSAQGGMWRVHNIRTKKTATEISRLTFDYTAPNQTKVTDIDGRCVEYQFGRFGQTVNLFYPDEGLSAYYEYGAEGGATKKLTSSSKAQSPTVNFVTNHGFYPSLSGWTEEKTGSATGETTYSTLKHLDARSLYIKKTDTATASSLGRKYSFSALPADPGYYTFTAYVKTENLTPTAEGGGAQLVLTYKNLAGQTVTRKSEAVSGTGTEWARLEIHEYLLARTTDVSLHLTVENASGIARFDTVQFERSAVANRVNLLYNHDLEDVTSGLPTKWTGSELASADTASTSESYSASRAFRIGGKPSENKNLHQTIYLQGSAGDSFVFGAMAKGSSVPYLTEEGADGRWGGFNVVLEFYDENDLKTETFKTNFNFGSTDWQTAMDVAATTKAYRKIIFYLTYYKNANEVFFDLPQLYRENFGQSYTHDDKGNVVSVSDLAETESTFEYSGANELIAQNNPTGTEYTYTYDTANDRPHRLISATAAGVTTTYTYGSFGNARTAQTKSSGDDPAYFEATSEYTSNGNYQTSSTDTLGNKTTYQYNTTKGTLTSVTDPKGYVTSYTYNANTDALTSVTQGQSTVSYTYAADRLSTISTESSTYTFTYDEAGNTKQIKVGDRTLITNTYDLSRGLLWYSVYGNGSSRNYTYDALGRLIAETNDDYPIEPVYEYFYDNAGNLALVRDHDRGTETRYVYDLADRLVRVEDSAGLTVTYEYDDAGRRHKLSYTVGGETVTQEMTYGEGALADRPSGLKVNEEQIKSYTYDSLNRVTKTTLNTTAPVETNYTYLNHPTTANQTSSVVAGVKVGANAQYTYSYDQNGNIIRENKGGYTKYSYSYDEKGQLTGFSDADVYYDDAPSEYWYEYDDAGNLTDVYFGNSQDEERVAQYQYTDSSWGDLLTSFNGQTITYDAIGNPLNYYDGNIFTWKNGRQLVSWEHGSGVTYGSLEYDTEGYRTSKTTENGETSYLYSGGSLLRETKTNPTTNATVYDLYFTYDEVGRPFSISSYSETLYYFYDIYGNVKYLYDAYGNLVAEYTYHDPWGNDVELTCHYFEGFSIAELNPFTYKGYYYDAD